ncbi:MAG: EAL domain-containing protein [Pseudomonadota bacterium]
MTRKKFDIDAMTDLMAPDSATSAQYRAYLEFDESDAQLLRDVHPYLQAHQSDVVLAFYEHLLRFPRLRQLLDNRHAFARLKHLQAMYFDSLTAGDYDDAYERNRVRVGLVHQHVGLEIRWYIGAYRKYLAELAPILRQALAGTPERYQPTYDALLKLMCLDMSLALDTYEQAGRIELSGLKNYAEQVITSLPSGVMVIDAARQVRTVNPAMCAMLGVAAPAGDIDFGDFLHLPELCERIDVALRVPSHCEELMLTLPAELPTGSPTMEPRYLRCALSRALLDGENLLLLIAEDLTIPMRAKAALRDSEERFRIAFDHAAVGLAQAARDGRWLRANRKFQDIVGYSEEELKTMSFREMSLDSEMLASEASLRLLLAGEIPSYAIEKRYVRKDGESVWVNVAVSRMVSGDGEVNLMIVVEDIARRKQYEHELRHMASHDVLTGLANRSLLMDRLDQALALAHRDEHEVALLFIDLDRFKTINDSLGHEAGDHVIVEAGRRLAAIVREGDTVARLGGDEFVVLMPDIPDSSAAAVLSSKLLEALLLPMNVLGHEFSPVGSIGISIYPRDGLDSNALLKNADAAMYRAKELGRGNFQFYTEEMNARTLDRLRMESGLRRALERHEFVLHYQPQIDLATGEQVGVEALLRWCPPGGETVAPSEFIPIAEETGMIVEIGAWVLRAACEQLVAWCEAGLPPMTVAVNLSARQFHQQNLVQLVGQILAETGCDASLLELEITESVVMADPAGATATLHELKEMGVNLSIDDFGTGHSSLSYLKRFPIHALKIDRSFVRDLTTDADDAAIVCAVIALAHTMQLKVIAEGVETEEQLKFLREHDCDQFQGFFYSPPVSAERLRTAMERRSRAHLRTFVGPSTRLQLARS